MKLQTQDFIGAQDLQQQLLKLNPKDTLITQFSALLPDEVAAQKEALGEEEYYDEEEDEEEDKEEDKEDEKEEEEAPVQEEEKNGDPNSPEEGAEEEKKDEGDSEYDEDAYGEEDYDEEGRYIWGKEGNEWDWYYKEDKEAHERGDPVHPEVINELPKHDEEAVSEASTATGLSAVYKTKKKGSQASSLWRPQ